MFIKMKKGLYAWKLKAGIVLGMCSFMILMTGCGIMARQITDAVDIVRSKRVNTDCNVASVAGGLGANDYVCRNSFSIYVYHNNAIYDYTDMEKLVDVEQLKYMACNEDVLLYSVETNKGELWCYDLQTKENKLVSDAYKVVGMRGTGQEIFVTATSKEEMLAGEYFDLYCFHEQEEALNVNEWITRNESCYSAGWYSIYDFGGYNIVVDETLDKELPQVVLVENNGDFQYSCSGYNVYGRINEEYFKLTPEICCEYGDIKTELTEIMELSDYDPGFSASQVAVNHSDIYILEQYGKGTWGYQENPAVTFKDFDALFKVSPETEECVLLYQCREGEQLAGFSVEENCVFLLKKDGVYQYDLSTSKEQYIVSNEEYKGMVFEYMENELFIFQNPYTTSEGIELLLITD